MVSKIFKDYDIIIMSSAVSDYTPITVYDQKVKKSDGDMNIPLKRTKDILAYVGENKLQGQYVCGFSMETENIIQNSKAKLIKKHADMIVANSLKQQGAGFGTDTNIVTIITDRDETSLPILSKHQVAEHIINHILKEVNSI